MSKNKKKGEVTISKAELRQKLENIFSNHPTQNYNYKQLAMRLQIKGMDSKRQISEVLRDLRDEGKLEEISTGRFKQKQTGAYITGWN